MNITNAQNKKNNLENLILENEDVFFSEVGVEEQCEIAEVSRDAKVLSILSKSNNDTARVRLAKNPSLSPETAQILKSDKSVWVKIGLLQQKWLREAGILSFFIETAEDMKLIKAMINLDGGLSVNELSTLVSRWEKIDRDKADKIKGEVISSGKYCDTTLTWILSEKNESLWLLAAQQQGLSDVVVSQLLSKKILKINKELAKNVGKISNSTWRALWSDERVTVRRKLMENPFFPKELFG